MKPFQKLKVVLCFFIFISYFPLGGHAFTNSIDTLPPVNDYIKKGYRLSITSIKVEKSNSKTAKIVYNISNAGRNHLKLGKGRNIPQQLIFEFDQSLNEGGLFNHAKAIATAIREQKISLRPGQLLMSNKLKVNLNNKIADLVIVKKGMDEHIPETQIVEENSIENIEEIFNEEELVTTKEESDMSLNNTITEDLTLPSTILKTSTPEVTEEEVVKNQITKMPPLVNSESIILNSTSTNSNLPKIEEVEIETIEIETVVEESVEDKIDTPSEEIETVTEIAKAETTTVEMIPPTKQPLVKDNEVDEVTEPIVEEEEVVEAIDEFADAPHYEVDLEADVEGRDFLKEDICADLVMESVKIIKQSDKSVTLEYVVANYGNGSAALFGKSKKEDDNVAIKAHLSKSRKLTRGSLPLKGAYISKGVKNKSGMLLPKERVTNTMKIDVSKMTKFTPVLILSLDGFQDVEECDEFNNVVYINLIEVNKVAYAKPSRPKSDTKVLSKVEEQDQ